MTCVTRNKKYTCWHAMFDRSFQPLYTSKLYRPVVLHLRRLIHIERNRAWMWQFQHPMCKVCPQIWAKSPQELITWYSIIKQIFLIKGDNIFFKFIFLLSEIQSIGSSPKIKRNTPLMMMDVHKNLYQMLWSLNIRKTMFDLFLFITL